MENVDCKGLNNPIRPSSFSCSPGPKGAQRPKIKVNINRLKWNFVWVIITIKAFLIQNLRLLALLVLEIWRHKISLRSRNNSSDLAIYPRKTGLTFKNEFYVQNRSSRPKIDPPPHINFSNFQAEEHFFHFQNFWGRLN